MVKMRLKSRGIIPYGGGFRTKDRQTGMELFAVTWDNLIIAATKSRTANGIPIGLDFENEVEQWICEDMPDEAEFFDPDIPRKQKLTLDDVLHGTKVMAAFKMGGSKVVDADEVQRRVNICVRCPMNTGYTKPCSGICAELKTLVLSIVGNRVTPQADRLHACNICGCFLEAAVWLPLETQCVGVSEEMLPKFSYMQQSSNCWKQCA